jgi:hypothetical protein
MFLTHPIKSYGFEYSLVRLESDQSDTSKVSVPFLSGTYELFLAWTQAQVEEIVVEEPKSEETAIEEPQATEPTIEEPQATEPTARKLKA